jgi:hypothetical protein
MVTRTLTDLTKDLADRRRLSEPPPVVLLGAGASAGAGLSTMQMLYAFLGVAGFDEFVTYIESRTDNERYRLLSEFLQTQNPLEVTRGYRALAELCEKAYFDIVVTTNVDPLLDDALVAAGMRRRDYMLLINGVLRADRLRWLLASRSPRVKVLKLHGDLFHRFMAWTPAEMERYLDDVQGIVAPLVSTRDFIVVGNSLRDGRIRNLVENAQGAIWFITPGEVPPEVLPLPDVRAVTGPDLIFENVFPALLAGLGHAPGAPGAAARGATTSHVDVNTTDDLIGACVGLASSQDGEPELSGFLLDSPRMVVTDGAAGNQRRFGPDGITVITSTGARFGTVGTRLLDHPFGPWLLEMPSGLHSTCLHVDPTPLTIGETVHIAVAAGEGIGLSTGRAVSGIEETIRIEPIGMVDHLVRVDAAVRPGASGAPVVDDVMNVRGFVVAGSNEPNRPVTFIYPASRWAAEIAGTPQLGRKSTSTEG